MLVSFLYSTLLMHLELVIVYLLLGFGLVSNAVSEDDESPCPSSVKPETDSLREKLLCNYDREVRPVKDHRTPTNVSIFIFLRFIQFREKWNILNLHSFSSWSWKDEFLTWNKSTYPDQKPIRLSTNAMWVPDIEVFTVGDMGASKPQLDNRKSILKSDGSVQVGGPNVHNARCISDVTKWPFDVQNCTMRVGSWTHDAKDINLTISSKGISILRFAPNRDWDLLSTTAMVRVSKYGNTTFHTAEFNLIIKRHAGLHAAIVFIPSLVLATLTLVTFWLDPGSIERLFVIYINILCHCLYLQYLGVTLPSNGDKYPVILIFFRDSLLLVAVTLIITLLIRRMDAASSPLPVWITALTDSILATFPDPILMLTGLEDKGVVAVDANLVGNGVPTSPGWRRFAALLDRLLFLVFFVTLLVLVSAFLP